MAGIGREAGEIVRGSRVVLVATLSPAARPFMTPLWFVRDGGVLYLTSGTQSWSGRNVAGHPAVTLLFGGERGTASHRVVRLRGRATCETGSMPWRVLVRLTLKYYLAPRALAAELTHVALWPRRRRYRGQGTGGAGYLRVVPTSAELLPLA